MTGCAGFVGSHVTEALLRQGHTVVGVDNFDPYYSVERKRRNLQTCLSHREFSIRSEDVCGTTAVSEFRPHVIVHLAARAGVRPSLEDPVLYSQVNVGGFVHLLEEARRNNVVRVVYASSSSVYGLNEKVPFSEDDAIDACNSPYACSKRCMEIYAKMYGQLYNLETVGLRFFTVYGPRGRPDMAPHKFLSAIREDRPITLFGDGSSARDYTYIDDIVRGVVASATAPMEAKCSLFNLGNSSPVSLGEFVAACERAVGKQAKILRAGNQPGDVPRTYADISKAHAALGYCPSVSVEEGLRRTAIYMLAQATERLDVNGAL